jgi:hypothetical protein
MHMMQGVGAQGASANTRAVAPGRPTADGAERDLELIVKADERLKYAHEDNAGCARSRRAIC